MGQGVRFSTRDVLFATALVAVSCVAWGATPDWSNLPYNWWPVDAAWVCLAFGLPVLAAGVLLKRPYTFAVLVVVVLYIAILAY
jgi:hypothetical protein